MNLFQHDEGKLIFAASVVLHISILYYRSLFRSSRAGKKPNFRNLDNGDPPVPTDDDGDWSSEDAEEVEVEGSGAAVGRKRKRTGGGVGGPARSRGAAGPSRSKKTAAVDNLEAAAKEVEAAVAQLAPQALTLKEKYAALEQENAELKRRIEILMAQAAQQPASGGGSSSLPATAGLMMEVRPAPLDLLLVPGSGFPVFPLAAPTLQQLVDLAEDVA